MAVLLPENTAAGRRDAPALCFDAHGVDRRTIHDAAVTAAVQLFGTAKDGLNEALLRAADRRRDSILATGGSAADADDGRSRCQPNA